MFVSYPFVCYVFSVKHDIRITGDVFALRPVELRDAGFIVDLRTDPRRSTFINRTAPLIEDQEAWLERYFARPGDYYFIIERRETRRPEGTVAIYDEEPVQKRAQWGRWIARVGSRAGIEGLWLMYRVAFEMLDLEMVYARTSASNKRALAVHEAYGLEPYAHLAGLLELGDTRHDAVEHRMMRSRWADCEPLLRRMAAHAARGEERRSR